MHVRRTSANGMDRPCSEPHPVILGAVINNEHYPLKARRSGRCFGGHSNRDYDHPFRARRGGLDCPNAPHQRMGQFKQFLGERMSGSPSELIRGWLRRQLPEPAEQWLDAQLAKLAKDPSERNLQIALGMAPRRLGKDDLALSQGDLAAAEAARPGWDPRGWSVDEAARILTLVEAGGRGEGFAKRFTALCQTADAGEAIALYRGLPLYPDPELLEAQAAEGVRSNMRATFEAVAHRNPFPRERFDENRWNQMVVKALFIGSTMQPVQGLDGRANPALAKILCDYAHERWAAGRPIAPELWRCVGPFAQGAALADLKRAAEAGDEASRKAAALALAASPAPEAKAALAALGELASAIESGGLSWESLAQEMRQVS